MHPLAILVVWKFCDFGATENDSVLQKIGQGLPPVNALPKILAKNGRDTMGFAKSVVKK